jgi:TolA-binding protein
MTKRTVILALLLLALAAPAALAANGPTAGGAAARAGGQPGQRLQALRVRLRHAAVVARRCASGKADQSRCKTAAQRLLDGLRQLDGRIDDRVAKLQERCGSTTEQPAPPACQHVDQIVSRLHQLQSRLRELEQKLQAWLDGGGTSSTNDTSSTLTTIDQVTQDLAAAQAGAGS